MGINTLIKILEDSQYEDTLEDNSIFESLKAKMNVNEEYCLFDNFEPYQEPYLDVYLDGVII